MKIRSLSVLAGFLSVCAVVAPARAGVSPYVRLGYGGNELKMTGENSDIRATEAVLRDAGLNPEFQKIGSGYGPEVAVGLWLTPGFRLGATYSYLRATRTNRVDVPGEFLYADDLDFRMNEVGAEAALRFRKLAGLTVGANVGGGRGERIERCLGALPGMGVILDQKADRTRMTFGGFIGLDRTNASGLAGYVRAGFQYRDLGHMHGDWTESVTVPTGTSTFEGTATTPEVDFSGFYVRIGVGYDLVH
jgi:hypothetical protein